MKISFSGDVAGAGANSAGAFGAGGGENSAAAFDAGAAESPPAFDTVLFGRRYRLASADRAFWSKVAAGEWEPATLRFFERTLCTQGPDSACVDVGAWVGPTALFAAQFCHRVFAVEPDPAAYERLLANLRMNAVANIAPCHAAIAAADGHAQLANHRHFGNSMTRALSTVDDGAGDGGCNGVGAGGAGGLSRHSRSPHLRHPRSPHLRHPRSPLSGGGDAGGNRATVLGLRLATFIDWFGIARIDLLKIDIEGGEFALLPALLELPARLRPAVHLSLHAPLLPAAERAEKLSTVAELASQYAHIYDADNAAVTAAAIANEARFRDNFQAVGLSQRRLF